jgi:hypothetical protein
MNALVAPVELADSELDLVAAGLNSQHGLGLIVANIGVDNVLNGFKVSALNNNQVTLTDVASNNTITVPIGVAVAALGGAAGVLNKLA